MYATRQDIIREFTILNNRITNPGKFEGNHIYVPYFYDLMLNGSEDDIIDDEDGNMVSVFELTDDDKHMFPELLNYERLKLWETDQGFVEGVVE